MKNIKEFLAKETSVNKKYRCLHKLVERFLKNKLFLFL